MCNAESGLNIKTFNDLFSEYQQRFVRFATTYICDSAIAEDIVMESFEASWEKRDILDVNSFPAYTMTIIKHKCLNHLRSKCVRERASVDILSTGTRLLTARIATLQACDPEELFSREAIRLVNETLDALPERTRSIFVSSRFDGKSYKEIAEQRKITVKSVEFELSKAMKAMRHSLKDYLALLFIMFILK